MALKTTKVPKVSKDVKNYYLANIGFYAVTKASENSLSGSSTRFSSVHQSSKVVKEK